MAVDVFDILAKLRLDDDEYNRALDNAEGNSKASSGRLGSIFGGLVKGTVAMVGTASVAIGALMKTSIANYANYEQLTGGIETLFKGSQDKVMEYAENAYKTAGMSANAYMETVTGFSASLIQSLGGDTDKAAEKANQAITDMSDNANKMGTSMDVIEQTYQGFAKQNYTMLDNLKLGYGGTKEEMQRLLEDASAISGIKYDISSYADIVDAIHVVQTETGITGTTAKEAGSTISGSIGMAKAAWTNLVTGMASPNADLGKLIGDFVASAKTALIGQDGNGGIVKVIQDLAPSLVVAVSGVVTTLIPALGDTLSASLPAVITGITSLIDAVVKVLPTLIQGVIPPLVGALPTVITALVNGILIAMPTLLQTGIDLIVKLAEGFTVALPTLLKTIMDVLDKLIVKITDKENLDALISAALTLLATLAQGLIDALPRLAEAAVTLIENLVTYLTDGGLADLLDTGVALLLSLIDGIVESIPKLIPVVVDIIEQIVMELLKPENLQMIIDSALDIVMALASGVVQFAGELMKVLPQLLEQLVIYFTSEDFWLAMKDLGKQVIWGLVDGIFEVKDKLVEAGKDIVAALKSVFTSDEGFDINSPSRVMKMYGKYIMEGLDGGLTESKGQVLSTTDDMIESVKAKFSSLDGMTASASIVTAQTGTYSFGQTPKQKEEANTNALLALLVEMFSNGTAKTSVDNTRELRRALA